MCRTSISVVAAALLASCASTGQRTIPAFSGMELEESLSGPLTLARACFEEGFKVSNDTETDVIIYKNVVESSEYYVIFGSALSGRLTVSKCKNPSYSKVVDVSDMHLPDLVREAAEGPVTSILSEGVLDGSSYIFDIRGVSPQRFGYYGAGAFADSSEAEGGTIADWVSFTNLVIDRAE